MSELFSKPRAFGRRVRRALTLSRVALWAEALARALWPAFSVACLVAAAVVLGAFQSLDATLHIAALAASALAVLGALVLGFRDFRSPGSADALRRLDASVAERPLATLTDRLAGASVSPVARALWLEHQRRAEAASAGLRAAAPDLRLAARDRWALRLFAPILLVGSFIGAGDHAPDRLRSALIPGEARAGADGVVLAEPSVEAWAVPPAYTGAETVVLSRRGPEAGPLSLPQGTEITIRATGLETAPALSAELFSEPAAFADLGGGLYETTGRLVRSGRLAMADGGEPMADWSIEMIPDDAPQIELTGEPGPTPAQALAVPFAARDDYGVMSAWVEIRLADDAEERMEVEPIEFALPLPLAGDPREVEDRAERDLTDHPWAGADVVLTLHVEDGASQRGIAGPVRLRLPERRWTDPLARALAEQRRELILDYAEAERVLDTVQAITRRPDEVFAEHSGAYLAVRMAVRRLAPAIVEDRVGEVAPDVAEFLWQAALTLESGDLASALERLRQAEERLRNALESGTDEEVRQAMDELRQAINEYLEEMVRQALQNPDALDQQPMDPNAQQLSRQDLEEMLDQMQRQAESGLRDQARDMLSQLSQMLQNLQAGRMQPGQSPGQQALEQLQELIQRQQRLSEETFDELRQQRRDGQQGQPGQQGQQGGQMGQNQPGQQGGQPGQRSGEGRPGGAQGGRHSENGRLAAEQEALREAIEELRRQLGRGGEGMDGASRSLGDAGRSMGEARDDLEGNETGEALQDQMDALDRLNEGAEALAQQMQQGQGQTAASGMQDGEGRAQDRDSIDPFDRPSGAYGAIDGSSTEVPGQSLVDRARELLEELRRRSADRERPEIELRYLERLLEQF